MWSRHSSFPPKSTSQGRNYERAGRIFTKRSFCGVQTEFFLQAEQEPTTAKKLNQVSRGQCRLGYFLGGPARPREKHSHRPPKEARRLRFRAGKKTAGATHSNQMSS